MGATSNSNNLQNGFPTPGPQTPNGQKVMDHVFFMSNSEWKSAREENNYDMVIIGSSFCALATAKRALERNPFYRILIVERGTFFLPEHFQNLPMPFVNTLGGLSETFPWTLTAKTDDKSTGTIRWQHGMIPFIGGRSTMWSAWCPIPDENEFAGWPRATIDAAKDNFASAKELLRVQDANDIDSDMPNALMEVVVKKRPVYGVLQETINDLLNENAGSVNGVYRYDGAPLASGAENVDGIDFQKYSVPGELLELIVDQRALAAKGKGSEIDMVADCIVDRIFQQNGKATALNTSRGVLPLGAAELVLAMGTLPPTTLARNSFPAIKRLGDRFSAHFITSIVARIPKADFERSAAFGELEIGAFYIAGTNNGDFSQQYHIQLSVLADKNPEKNSGTALRYMPDVVATASMAQLESSEKHVVFVCAVLGELDSRNDQTWFHRNPQDDNLTTNSLLQVIENESDKETWSAMDEATFGILEKALSPNGSKAVEYWHGDPDKGRWESKQPTREERRVDALVHESSTLHIGEEEEAPVDLNYRLKGTENVYITGGALWPHGGSWNPTLTMVALAQDLADKLVDKASSTSDGRAVLAENSRVSHGASAELRGKLKKQ